MIIANKNLDSVVSVMIINEIYEDHDIYFITLDKDKINNIKELISQYQQNNPIYFINLMFTLEEIKKIRILLTKHQTVLIDYRIPKEISMYFNKCITGNINCVSWLSYGEKHFSIRRNGIILNWIYYSYQRATSKFNSDIDQIKCSELENIVKYLIENKNIVSIIKKLNQISPEKAIKVYREQFKKNSNKPILNLQK